MAYAVGANCNFSILSRYGRRINSQSITSPFLYDIVLLEHHNDVDESIHAIADFRKKD
jgi:hypothetical protein